MGRLYIVLETLCISIFCGSWVFFNILLSVVKKDPFFSFVTSLSDARAKKVGIKVF